MIKMLSCVTLLTPLIVNAAPYGPVRADVVRVLDGDTIEVNVHLWPGLTKKTKVRLLGIDTAEKRSKSDCERKLAARASAFSRGWLDSARKIQLVNIKPGKFTGRVLANIETENGLLSDALIEVGLAKPYNGGKRQPWC